MRLHRLDVTAFGPFATAQHIDLDELSAAGLFLLHGPTGAGKTSVLDAVCYALYGQVPGARPATRLRSDHAAPGTRTEVVLELTLAGRRLEITRRPEQQRAKKRGTGTTTDKAVTLLREWDGTAWQALSKSHQEAGEEIRQLVGMSCEQFCQVVLLPQGEFATFLRASATERATLLGRLFDTRRFRDVEAWLRDRRLEAAHRLGQGDQDLTHLATSMRQAAGDDAPPLAARLPDVVTAGHPDYAAHLLQWAAELRSAARERHDIAAAAVAGAESAHTLAAARAQAARELHADQQRHAEAQRRAAALEAARPVRAAARSRLARAHRAAAVEPALALREKAAAQLKEATAAARAAEAPLRSADDAPRLPRARAEALPPGSGAAPPDAAAGREQAAAPPDAPASGTPVRAEQGRPGVVPGPTCPTPSSAQRSVPAAQAPAVRPGSGLAAGAAPDAVGRERPAYAATLPGACDGGTGVPWPRLPGPGADAPGLAQGTGSGGAATDDSARRRTGPQAAGPGDRRATAADGQAPGEAADDRTATARPGEGAGVSAGGRVTGDGPGASSAAGAGAGSVRPEDVASRAGAAPVSGRDGSVPAGGRYAPLGAGAGPVPADPPAGRAGAGGGPDEGPQEPADGFGADVLTAWAHRLREEWGELAAAVEAEDRLAEIAARRESLAREESGDEDVVRDADGWLEGWPAARARLRERVDAAQEAAARAAGLDAARERAGQRAEAARERDVLARERARAEDVRREARDRRAGAREAWQDLREARITGIAAELAEALADGEPCRVCGSPSHPAPARPAGRQVTRADEEAAYALYQRESAAYDTARDAVSRLAAALDAATVAAGGTPAAELAAAHAVLAAEHASAARLAAGAHPARAALAAAEEEHDRRTAQRHAALARGAARTSRREELDEQHARLSAELDKARGGHASAAERRDRLAARIALVDRAGQAVRARDEARTRLAAAETALSDAVRRAGFASAAEAHEALLPAERLRQAEREAEEWAKEEAAVEADLAAPGPAQAAALPPADPAAAQAALEAATGRLRHASAQESAAVTRRTELDRLGVEATAAARELAPARDDFARIRRLSELVSANSPENRYRMELETYVLAARLEQVAAAAAVRLQRMSSGRYTLEHTDARAGGRGKSGLGLMVVDAWTGTARDTSTLSGGETFFASLALALGLADVVTDEAGGVRLDTLFIDEGFGSLDDQTLDEVLDVLDGLRERDRAVGIVSHVADLRHRIPAQLQVVKGRDGSSVRLRTAGATAGR